MAEAKFIPRVKRFRDHQGLSLRRRRHVWATVVSWRRDAGIWHEMGLHSANSRLVLYADGL
jgi:hypothetical protein